MLDVEEYINLDFPVASVAVKVISKEVGKLSSPLLFRAHLEVNENDFSLEVHNVASYRVQNGNNVRIHPHENADRASIELFLNGSVLGAVLHQRGILPFHGSSFEYEGKGVIICGSSGTGKSSITVAFCQNGGRFITDDITPVRIDGSATTIIPIKTRIKLWDDSFQKLKIGNDNFEKIRPTLNKFYLSPQKVFFTEKQLNHIIILSKHNKDDFEMNKLSGMLKYNALRNQIYRKMYLKGMPETEKNYFKQLFKLASTVRVTQIFRPDFCDIYETMNCIKKEIDP